jgi:SAM-dependent methyltransferase
MVFMSTAALQDLLDTTTRYLADSPPRALDLLTRGLQALRASCARDEWQAGVEVCRRHPLRGLLREDPFARRCQAQPRGYAGDPELLDLVYLGLPEEQLAAISALGQALFDHHTRRSDLARALRGRRETLRALVDTTADRLPAARVLAVGCGHLREAHLAAAVADRALGAYVALDQDPAALAVVQQELGASGVTPFRTSIHELIAGRTTLGRFDLIYVPHLYDSLDQSTALRLTALLFSRLNPGGDLLIAGLSQGFPAAAYLEAFLDWPLACRDEDDMLDLLSSVPGYELAGQQYFFGKAGDVAYLAAQKT